MKAGPCWDGVRPVSMSAISSEDAPRLASRAVHGHAEGMFVITEADAAAIGAIFNEEGELSAAIELRRRFPGLSDNRKARACARTIAGWTPLPAQLSTVTRLHLRKDAQQVPSPCPIPPSALRLP
jgi:hypothetical protein